MKRLYVSPALQILAFCADNAFASLTGEPTEDGTGSQPWNDGELGWTS